MQYMSKELIEKELKREEHLLGVYKKRRDAVAEYGDCRLDIRYQRKIPYYSYHRKSKPEKIYLGRENHPTVVKIREYRLCNEMATRIEKNITQLSDLLLNYSWLTPEKIKEILPKHYVPIDLRGAIISHCSEDKWYNEMLRLMEQRPKNPEGLKKVKSMDGTPMRSREEVIVYDTLRSMGLIVLYEFPLKLPDGRIIYPDFLILHPGTRTVYVWEHLGLWYHAEKGAKYQQAFCRKTLDYAALGFGLGSNLITSYPTVDGGIDAEKIRKMCKQIFFTEAIGIGKSEGISAPQFLTDQKNLDISMAKDFDSDGWNEFL